MTPAESAPILEALAGMPAWLRNHAAKLTKDQAFRKPSSGGFSLLENVWHLADFEREGLGVRIRRIVAEDNPQLPDFDGEAVARDRKYLERDLSAGLAAFESARAENLACLRQLPAEKWARTAIQDGYGSSTLADLPARTAEHDRSHREEIESLVAELQAAGEGS